MKSRVEIVLHLASLGWSLQKLSDELCLTSSTVIKALQNPADKRIRQKIAQKVNISYSELFGEGNQ